MGVMHGYRKKITKGGFILTGPSQMIGEVGTWVNGNFSAQNYGLVPVIETLKVFFSVRL